MREERQLGAGNAGLMVPAGAAGWERRFTSKKRVEGGGGGQMTFFWAKIFFLSFS